MIENYLLDKKIPSHCTLKYTFNTKKIKEIEKMFEIFIKTQKPSTIKVKRLLSFNNRVICFKLDFSKESKIIYNNLHKELSKFEWLEWRDIDNIKEKLHATLVCASSLKNFKKINNYLSKLNLDYNINFDNITILNKPREILESI